HCPLGEPGGRERRSPGRSDVSGGARWPREPGHRSPDALARDSTESSRSQSVTPMSYSNLTAHPAIQPLSAPAARGMLQRTASHVASKVAGPASLGLRAHKESSDG